MALLSRRVSDICEASFFVAPLTESGRQLTLARISLTRLGDDDNPLVNILVLPVPNSVFRAPVILDARQYAYVWDDLPLSFEQPLPRLPEEPTSTAFNSTSSRLRVCGSLTELKHARMDGLALRLPAPLLEEAELRYGHGFSFIVVAFRERPVNRLLLAYTHPLLRDSLFVPLFCAAPRGIPRGERPSIAVDDAPAWSTREACIYSVDTGSQSGKSPPRISSAKGTTTFVARRIGLDPTSSIRVLNVQPRQDKWLPLSSLYHGLLQLQSLIACGDFSEAQRVVSSMMKKKPMSCVVRAHHARLCGLQGERDHAKLEFESAIDLEPDHWVPWAMLGQFHLEHGRHAKAARAFRRALERNPNEPSLAVGLALCLPVTNKNAQEEARSLLRRAIKLDPSNTDAANGLAALDHSVSALPYADRLVIAKHEQQERKDAAEHFDAYFTHLHEESRRLFVAAPTYDENEQ